MISSGTVIERKHRSGRLGEPQVDQLPDLLRVLGRQVMHFVRSTSVCTAPRCVLKLLQPLSSGAWSLLPALVQIRVSRALSRTGSCGPKARRSSTL